MLFECLTGKRAFPGETITETLASILKSEPDWTLLPAETPAPVRSLLRRCLQKNPGQRVRDIRDARLEMEAPAAPLLEALTAPRRFSLVWLVVCAAVILLAGILIDRLWTKYFQSPSSAVSVITSTIKVEPGHWLEGRTQGPGGATPEPDCHGHFRRRQVCCLQRD